MKYTEKDRNWRISVAYKAGGLCEMCETEGCDPHHLFKRRKLKTRWEPDNGTWLCRKCHNWAESNPRKFKEWFIRTRGAEIYKKLIDKSKEID